MTTIAIDIQPATPARRTSLHFSGTSRTADIGASTAGSDARECHVRRNHHSDGNTHTNHRLKAIAATTYYGGLRLSGKQVPDGYSR
jgi:hypothetical protein